MTITRGDLENDRMRQVLRASALAPLVLSDQQLEASLQETLRGRPAGAVWLFAYGSLLWSPGMPFAERRVALLRGYHRGFYLLSRAARGTPERPGLALALDRGGSCRGLICRLPSGQAEKELRLLWRREMALGSYQPRWLPVSSGGRRTRALAFVVRRDGPGYAGRLPDAAIIDTLLRCRGLFGSGADYLLRTAQALAAHGIRDARLSRLEDLLLARLAPPGTPG